LDEEIFKNKKILITGGLGFIGSNLAMRLVDMGSEVTLLDAMIDGLGGNLFNIKNIKDRVKVNISDIRNVDSLSYCVKAKDYIFHLAGQNDHVLSQKDPFPDISINVKGSLALLEACKKFNRSAKVIYTGTRGEYGPAVSLPVKEDAPINPRGIYELSSLTAQKLFKIYNDNHRVNSVTLRLTNIFGERAQMVHDRSGVINWFVRRAIDNEVIKVFGDGSLLRDFLYVNDAVDAIIMCAACEEAYGEVFNVGGEKPLSFLEMAKSIIKIAGSGRWEFASFTEERAAQEPGDFYSDISKIKSTVGWKPKTTVDEGLKKTIEYYLAFKGHYW